ncbi:MAG TPA: nicotinate-nucleotide adenylyltransferase [Fimbriimonadaceae bacterium]|nr:nicotinate-nucleotide adenylyltransferase [Fimbriimonadaceae bacterium]
MRIGILGGTFDPPHIGHLELARAALDQLQLDEVMFLPAHRNPLKRDRSAPAKQRLEMVRRMVAGEAKMSVSDIEISRGGPSYMVETLMELQMVKPGDYWLLLGSDALKGFDRWKNPDKIIKLCRLGVVLRPPAIESETVGRLDPELQKRVDLIPMKQVDVSATEVRDRLAKGTQPVAPFLSPAVLQYIKQNHLYGS